MPKSKAPTVSAPGERRPGFVKVRSKIVRGQPTSVLPGVVYPRLIKDQELYVHEEDAAAFPEWFVIIPEVEAVPESEAPKSEDVDTKPFFKRPAKTVKEVPSESSPE